MNEVLLEKYGPLMDIDALAELMHLKRQSLYQSIYHGRLDIPHFKQGKKYLFATHEVAKYIDERMNYPNKH